MRWCSLQRKVQGRDDCDSRILHFEKDIDGVVQPLIAEGRLGVLVVLANEGALEA